jgi:hypothetical protein
MNVAYVDTAENFHPYECDGPGSCRHCDRRTDPSHNPAVCALCDPDYDMQPNPHRGHAAELSCVETEMRDAITDLEDCEHADADGRVQDREKWLAHYWTLTDRVLELERQRDALAKAAR